MSLTRRVAVLLAAIGTLLCIGTGPSSAASLKVASACNTVTQAPQPSSIYKPLTSGQIHATMHYCKLAKISVHTLRYWHMPQNYWRLYSRHMHQKCWQIVGLKESVSTCMLARRDVRQHTIRLVRYNTKVEQTTRPRFAKWLVSDFLCIHGGEAAWNANTGNGFYGGLQMNSNFMQTYGPEFLARWGTADNWPVWAQLTAAVRAYEVRGFGPWPLTAPACGLPTSPPTSSL